MGLIEIIKQELQNIFEGIGDRYASKRFNIPDEFDDFEKQYQRHRIEQNNKDNGTVVGTVSNHFNDNSKPSNIYLNPKNLRNFEPHVRAISDSDGNLFVAQIDEDFYHHDMADSINRSGIFNGKKLSLEYKNNDSIQWHRIGNSNAFGLSFSYIESLEGKDDYDDFKLDPNIINNLLESVRRVHPQFKFELKYWQDYNK